MAEVKARIEIVLFDDGNLNVNGPLADRILCYGMLDVARDVVRDHAQDAQKSNILMPLGPVNVTDIFKKNNN